MEASIGIILALGIGVWVFFMIRSKNKAAKPKGWLDLAQYPTVEYQLPNSDEVLSLPEYAYYRYRTPHFINKQVPCIVTNFELVDGQPALTAQSMLDSKQIIDEYRTFEFLGKAKPELFIYY